MAIADQNNMNEQTAPIDPEVIEAAPLTPGMIVAQSLEDWLAIRRKVIGASESPSILGCGYADENVWTVWAKKTGRMEDKPDNEMLWYGRKMQPLTLERFTIETGFPVRDLGEFTVQRHPTLPWLGATLDGLAETPDCLAVVEAKNIGQYSSKEWKADEPPLKVQVQIQHQLAVTGLNLGYAAATIGGNRLAFRPIERNDRFIAVMIERLEEFWSLVLEDRPPALDYSEATAIALAAIHPKDNGETITLPPEAMQWDRNLQRVKRHISILKRFKTEYENRLKAAIGDNTFGELPDGSGELYSWATIDRCEFVTQATTYRSLLRRDRKPQQKIKGPRQRTLPAPDAGAPVQRKKGMTHAEIRNVLLARKDRCRWCGKTLTKRTATLEHVIPKAQGGKHTWNNFDLACKPCNQKRGDTGLHPDDVIEMED